MEVGEKIRLERKNNKITMEELGAKIGLTAQAISNYERGERRPSFKILSKIADVLDVPLSDLTECIQKQAPLSEYTTEELLEELRKRLDRRDING